MSAPASSSPGVGPDPDSDLALRMTRREFGLRLCRAFVAASGALAARPIVRQVVMNVGYSGTGRGLLAAIARRTLRFWSWGKRWPR